MGELCIQDLAAYVTDPSMLSEDVRMAIEQREADDAEFAAQLQRVRILTQATMDGDMQTLARYANKEGVPLDNFIPDPYVLMAMEVRQFLNGAVSEEEADVYARYRKETDQSGAHETQTAHLDPDALQALVRAGLCTDVESAGATVLKVLMALTEASEGEEGDTTEQ